MNNRPFLAVFAGCWLGEITACNDVRMVFAALLFSGIFVLFFKKQMYEWRRAVLFSFAGFMLGALMFLYQNERFTRQEKALKGSEQVRAAGTARKDKEERISASIPCISAGPGSLSGWGRDGV